jgi:predicted glutamine amidotransferase
VAIFKNNKIELSANIIYADDDVVIITRYLYYNKSIYNSPQCPPSLYWNKTGTSGEQGILITSEPLMKYDSVLIPENTICIVDHKKYELSFRRL